MEKLKYALLFVLGVLSFASCYRDLGNYDYSEINQVTFSGFPEEMQYAYRLVDTVRVTPVIEGSLEGKDLNNYSLKWQAVVKSGSVDGATTFDLDSNRLDLKYFVQLPEAKYTVYLLVEDKTSGVTWRQGFDLQVTSATYEGWLILSEDSEGFSRLDMISTSTPEEEIIRNLWADSPLREFKGPKSLHLLGGMSAPRPVYFLAEEAQAKLDDDDFSYDYENDLRYEFAEWRDGFVPTCMVGTYGDCRLCIGKDGVYGKGTIIGAIYGMRLNKLDGETDYFDVAPAIGMSGIYYNTYGGTAILYDVTNQRFVQVTSDMNKVQKPSAEEKVFSFTTGKSFVHLSNTMHGSRGETYTILKDGAGKLWLYGIEVGNYNYVAQVDGHYYQLNAPEIERATAFAVHPHDYDLYYAVDNKIYCYNINSKACRLLPIKMESGEIVNQFSGEQITMLKFNIFVMGDYSKPAGSGEMQYRLIVGSKETIGDNALKGHVRMLELPATSSQNASVYRSYDGFGVVKDVIYRERN